MPTDGNLLRPSYSTQNKTSHTGVNQIIDPGQTLRRGGHGFLLQARLEV
jgi:hypothetical protein